MRHVYTAMGAAAGLFLLGSLAPVWLTVSAVALGLTVLAANMEAAQSCKSSPIKWSADVHHTYTVHHHVHHHDAEAPRVVRGHVSQAPVVPGQVVAPQRRAISQ